MIVDIIIIIIVVIVNVVGHYHSGSPADRAGLSAMEPFPESSGGSQVGGVRVTGRECPAAALQPIGELVISRIFIYFILYVFIFLDVRIRGPLIPFGELLLKINGIL